MQRNQRSNAKDQELAELTTTLSLLRTIDALVLESHISIKMVCHHLVEAITQATGYDFVALLSRSSHTREELTLNGWSGQAWLGKDSGPHLSRPLHLKLADDWFNQPGGPALIDLTDVPEARIMDLLGWSQAEAERFHRQAPLKTLYVVKLRARRRLVGLLVIGFLTPVDGLADEHVRLLDRLSESIGVALDNKLLFEENQSVLRQLRESNTKLKELDEAKDDFISMASHQLRTPLTSIKGYVSMIKEGDAGEVTDAQKQMLEQAYFSSQRMVYLIADLLNVSRLRTGKFIIESKPVDLVRVVAEEVEQLVEIAKSRKLTLDYEKPDNTADIPQLMLDETKTRQIIMNFVDNAIYYTPAGGHITVKLIDRPGTVELRVVDDGLGVPKREQAHLFTKFYRAENARKARPDGTGLGLFMAKKVIVEQGGSIIFESKEGKGSTFGFIFSKHKLAVPKS